MPAQHSNRVMPCQTFATFGKNSEHPHSIVHEQVDEPAKQQAVADLPHELARRTDAAEGPQPHRTRQLSSAGHRSSLMPAPHITANSEPLLTQAALTTRRIVDRLSVKVSSVASRGN